PPEEPFGGKGRRHTARVAHAVTEICSPHQQRISVTGSVWQCAAWSWQWLLSSIEGVRPPRGMKEHSMTAVTTRPLSASTDALLRFALRADATLTGLAGLAVAAFANPLSTISGLSPTTEYLIGAAFVFYGLAVYYLAALPSLRKVGIT